MSEDVNWIIPKIKNYPPSGIHNGKKEVMEFFTYFGSLLEAISFEPKGFYSDAENVFVTGHYDFKVKANGNLISSDWIEVFTFNNGKIKQYEEYTDTASFQNAFEK